MFTEPGHFFLSGLPSGEGVQSDATGVQVGAVLDVLFNYEGPHGTTLLAHGISFHLWAPTAQVLKLQMGNQKKKKQKIQQLTPLWSPPTGCGAVAL